MNIYQIIKNGLLSRKNNTGNIEEIFLEPVVSLQREEISFESDEIVPIVEDGEILDTNDPMMIAKYKNNLRLLVESAKEKGSIDKFLLIREDDVFPYGFIWRVNSIDTGREFARSNLAFTLRMAEARKRVQSKKRDQNNPFDFDIPGEKEDELAEAARLGENYGRVYEPLKFRSTKHFTINTPLPYTGTYNQVESGRRFIVIDEPDNFINSGYGYSADYQDAYLDVTHEGLKISDKAIILIDRDRYSEIIKDESIREQLNGRKVVLYQGDEATAINMVLSQNGVLPYRCGKYHQFDRELEDIMIQSMKNFCSTNNLEYAHNHGNMNGTGGHFSDLFDSENKERSEFESELCLFLQKVLPEYSGLLNSTFYRFPERIIKAIGHERVLDAVEQYNNWAMDEEVRRRKMYDLERESITEDVHELFINTLNIIKNNFEDTNIREYIIKFFHGNLEEQKDAAKYIQNYYRERIVK